jgi:hypothetical protein
MHQKKLKAKNRFEITSFLGLLTPKIIVSSGFRYFFTTGKVHNYKSA